MERQNQVLVDFDEYNLYWLVFDESTFGIFRRETAPFYERVSTPRGALFYERHTRGPTSGAMLADGVHHTPG